MYVLVENGSIIKTVNGNRGITIGENQYPQAIFRLWSPAEREAIGIYEVIWDNSNKKDGEYYLNTNQSFNFADGKATCSYGEATAKSLDDVTDEEDRVILGLKSQKKLKIKKQASSFLTRSDWRVIKASEVESYSVPSELTTYRANVRTRSNEMEVLVDACGTVDEVAALYIYTDGTRPLGEFPEEV
tara:strand:- start:250 stop:810 length:561 start_codon:yes stop_codon:yes gene_type:complete